LYAELDLTRATLQDQNPDLQALAWMMTLDRLEELRVWSYFDLASIATRLCELRRFRVAH
jgi:hypothetical protein